MIPAGIIHQKNNFYTARIVGCLLYTSDAADDQAPV